MDTIGIAGTESMGLLGQADAALRAVFGHGGSEKFKNVALTGKIKVLGDTLGLRPFV